MNRSLFILLGKNGKISRSLKSNLQYLKENVISISTENLMSIIKNKKSLESYIFKNIKYKVLNLDLIIINCLSGTTPLENEIKLNQKLIKNFESFKNKYFYIYLSTFEPQNKSLTKYRRQKKHMEKIILSQGDNIIRIGYFIKEKNKFKNNNNLNIIFSNLIFNPIYVPITFASYLSKVISEFSKYKRNNSFIKCYSDKFVINLSFKRPFINLQPLIKRNLIFIPLPFFLITNLLIKLALVFERFNFLEFYIHKIQKPISLYEQQNYISKVAYTKK